MLIDGINLLGASTAENFSITSGAALPSSGNNLGELFYLTSGTPGLYVYKADGWAAVGGGIDADAIADALGYTPAALDNGKVLSSQLPALAITDTYVVASQAEMLALADAEVGDVAVRTDSNKSYILRVTPSNVVGNWQELLSSAPAAPGTNTQILYNNNGTTAGSNALKISGSTLTVGTAALNGTITAANGTGDGSGGLTISTALPETNGKPGPLALTASGAVQGGGDVTVTAGGAGGNSYTGGSVTITGGENPFLGSGGNVSIRGGTSGAGPGSAGAVVFTTQNIERFRIRGDGAWALSGTANVGTAGQVLASNGAAAPTWISVPTTTTTNTYTKSQSVSFVTLASAATITIDATQSNNFRVVLGTNATLANPTGLVDGQVINLVVLQDATGARSLSYGNLFKWAGGTAPNLSTAPNARDVISMLYDATTGVIFASMSKAFA